MYLQIERTQKAKSEHKPVKKNSRTTKRPHSLKNDTISHGISSTDCLRDTDIRHVLKEHSYHGKRTYNWKGRGKFVEGAIDEAISHLKNALNDPMVQEHRIIIDAIIEVIKILEDPKLEIYPFFGGSDGLAAQGEKKISIGTKLIAKAMKSEGDLYRLAKTLIHEAFHIIGGCVINRSMDSICEEDVGKEEALKEMISKDDIQERTI